MRISATRITAPGTGLITVSTGASERNQKYFSSGDSLESAMIIETPKSRRLLQLRRYDIVTISVGSSGGCAANIQYFNELAVYGEMTA